MKVNCNTSPYNTLELNQNYSKNSLFFCGSGQLYKYCCIKLEKRKDLITINRHKSTEQYNIDNIFNSMLSYTAQERIPIKNFCKQNGAYLFTSILTIKQCDDLESQLKENQLSLSILNDLYISKIKELGEQKILEIFESKCNEFNYYKSRETIIKESIKSHFLGYYSVSIPTFIIQIESILRELGQLDNQDKFRSTLTDEKIKDEPLYSIKDDIKYYNSYIHKLFEGNKDQKVFNRNTILHGFNIEYHNETNSVLMLLTLFEIGNFTWWDNNLKKFKSFK